MTQKHCRARCKVEERVMPVAMNNQGRGREGKGFWSDERNPRGEDIVVERQSPYLSEFMRHLLTGLEINRLVSS
jgi:hypothetical protein